MGKIVTEFEVFDHGIENSQYFQGWSPPRGWEGSTGAGDNPHEAMEDALEMIAQGGDWELATVNNDLPETPAAHEAAEPVEENCPNCDGHGRTEIHIDDMPVCATCDGEGEIPGEDGEMNECPDCDGRGRGISQSDLSHMSPEQIEEETTEECPECGGTGQVEIEDYDNDLHYYVSVAVRGIDDNLDASWLTQTVRDVAWGIWESGNGDDTPILADALEEAGCTNEDLIAFLRSDQGDWEQVARVLGWMLGEYAMKGQNGTDYLKSNGLTFQEFVDQARAAYAESTGRGEVWAKMREGRQGRSWDTQEETDLFEETVGLYDWIKSHWPYGGTPMGAVRDYYNSVASQP